MNNGNGKSINVEVNCAADPDLTPKPLKVSKEDSGVSNPSQSSFFTALETQHKVVPTKTLSCTERPRSGSSIEELQEPSPSAANGGASLRVPRQRRNDTIAAIRAATRTAGPHPSQHLISQDTVQSKTPSHSTPTRSDPMAVAKISKTLKQCASKNPFLCNSTADERLNQSEDRRDTATGSGTLNRLGRSHRRAVTDGNASVHRKHEDHQTLDRRPSLKHRVITRLVNGLGARSQGPQITEESKTQLGSATREAHPTASILTQDVNEHRQSHDPRPANESSITDALMAFQAPHTRSVTYPFLAQKPQQQQKSRPVSFKKLSKPQGTSTLTGKLTFTPEFDSISLENGESMYVAIDFEATLPMTDMELSDYENKGALDVVVIVDNSVHTSPASLMAHCETARYLASILDAETDRLAVICSSADGNRQNTIAPLGRIDAQELKATLDGITTPLNHTSALNLASLLQIAQKLLVEQPESKQCGGSVRPTYGHIFLLTNCVDGSFAKFTPNPHLTFHFVCGSTLPKKREHWPHTNGWKLRSQTGKEPKVMSRKGMKDKSDDIALGLRRLVYQVRSGQQLGLLTNVSWGLLPGKDTVIEEVHGEKKVDVMQPGETKTVIVKVRCKKPLAAEAWLSGNGPAFDDMDAMFGEIERMFNCFSATPMVGAAVSYKHAAMASDVECTNTGWCHVKRYISSPGGSENGRKATSVLTSKQRVAVHQRLALHHFTQYSPGTATSAIQNAMGAGDRCIACPEYVELLIKEQQHAERIERRRSGYEPPDLSMTVSKQKENMKPSQPTTTDQQSDDSEPKPDAPDAARKVLNAVRLKSKPSESPQRI